MEPLRSGDPRRISSYEILNRLGAGGMGQVYLGRSPSGRRVAVKVIRPELTNDPTFRTRFRREVTAMRQVSGFFTAPVVDADPDGDPAWLATAFVPGPSLESAVAEQGAMPPQDVLVLAAGLAEALNAIHREGLTHRDLKPANVLLADDGPRVIDFGLAVTAQSATLTQAGTVVGTPAFMSPEQVSGQHVGPASDVWSLGAVLVYAATGAAPFGDGGTMETMLRVVNGEPDMAGLSGTLAQLATACLMKDPHARPTPARILQVLSEGAGVEATAAMGWNPPQAAEEEEEAAAEARAASEVAKATEAAKPEWPTADAARAASATALASGAGAGPAASAGSTIPAPAQTWGSGAASGPVAGSTPTAAPPSPAQPWGVTGASIPAAAQQPWTATPGPATAHDSPAQPGPTTPAQPMPAPHQQPPMPSNPWASPAPPSNPSIPSYQGAPPTRATPAANPWMQPLPSQPYPMPFPPPVPVKKNRNGLIAAVGVAAVVVIGGGIALVASSGGSGGSSGGASGGRSGGTLGGSGGIGTLTPVPADFQLSSLVTDADAAQYLKASPSAAAPSDDASDDPATFDKDWQVDSTGAELRVQASNYKADSAQATSDFLSHTSTLATDSKFEDQGALGNSDKTEIQVATDQSSGVQHCKIEVIRGGLDVTVTFVEPGSADAARADLLTLAKLVTGRLPAK